MIVNIECHTKMVKDLPTKRMGIFFSLLFFLISFDFICYSQTPSIVWQYTYGGSDNDYASFICPTNDHGFIAIGSTLSVNGLVSGNHGGEDTWVTKMDSLGNLIWAKCYGGALVETGASIQQTSDGGYIMISTTLSTDGQITNYFGGSDIWVVKIDDTGKINWAKNYGSSGPDFGYFIVQTSDGGYILAGMTNTNSGQVTGFHGGTGYDIWIVKIDDTGALKWEHCYGGSANDAVSAIHQTSDGGYIVAGYTSSSDGDVTFNHGADDYWVFKLNDTGAINWQKTYGGSFEDFAYSISQTVDGGFIVAGETLSNDGDVIGNHGLYDSWTVKLDDTGNITWEKCYGGSNIDGANYVLQTSDSGYLMVGSTLSTDGEVTKSYGTTDMWVVKTDLSGNLQWQKSLGGSHKEYGKCAVQINDSNFAILGCTASDDSNVTLNYGDTTGTFDFWLVKIHGVSNTLFAQQAIKKDLYTNIYPNPVSNQLYVEMPQGYENASLSISDVFGRQIPLRQQSNGTSRCISFSDVVSGIYFLQITNNSCSQTYKVVH